MIRILILIMTLYSLGYCLEGPDLMLSGGNFVPDPDEFNICSARQDEEGFKASFQNASLYHVNSLDWTYAGAKYSRRGWTVCGSFRTYGINDLYESSSYSVILHHLFSQYFSAGLGFNRKQIVYGENLYNHSSNSLCFDGGARFSSFYFDAFISNIQLGSSNELLDGDPEIILSGDWLANDDLTIYALYYRDSRHHDRFMVGQNLALDKLFVVNAGLLSSPEVYFFGFEIVYKRFVLGYTYYDISGLPNCSKLILGIR